MFRRETYQRWREKERKKKVEEEQKRFPTFHSFLFTFCSIVGGLTRIIQTQARQGQTPRYAVDTFARMCCTYRPGSRRRQQEERLCVEVSTTGGATYNGKHDEGATLMRKRASEQTHTHTRESFNSSFIQQCQTGLIWRYSLCMCVCE